MEQNSNNKIDLKNKLISFFNKNKLKIISFFGILFIIAILVILFQTNLEKKNNLISEKYIQAGLYLTSDNKKMSKNIYEEVILSKNKFYSILALNAILENNLVTDKNKISNYFEIIEEINSSEIQTDVILLKKALYLIKIQNSKDGNDLLKKLIDNNSKLKSIAEEIIVK